MTGTPGSTPPAPHISPKQTYSAKALARIANNQQSSRPGQVRHSLRLQSISGSNKPISPSSPSFPRQSGELINFLPEYMQKKEVKLNGEGKAGAGADSVKPSRLPGNHKGPTQSAGNLSRDQSLAEGGISNDLTRIEFSHSPEGTEKRSHKMVHQQGQGGQDRERTNEDPPPTLNDKVCLADIVSRLDSFARTASKIDSIAEDVKLLKNIQDTTNQLKQGFESMKGHVQQLQESVSKGEQERLDLQANQQVLAKEIIDLKEIVQQQQLQIQDQPLQSQSLSDFEKLKIDAAFRRNNLIIEGIRESRAEREGDTYKHITAFFKNVLHISYAEVDMIHRLGTARDSSAPPRPIFVRFTRMGDRMDVWHARSRLNGKGHNYYVIKEDLPSQLRPISAALSKVAQAAKNYPTKYRDVYIRDFKVFLNGRGYDHGELESLPNDIRPSSISTPGNVKTVVFFGKDSRFSNHYSSTFMVDDKAFSTMEQYLAFKRAGFAEREDLAKRAMESNDPLEAKRVLNLLRGEKGQQAWEEERRDVLFSGLLAKFSQSEDLKSYLLSSDERILGEASLNRVWGIGLTLMDSDKLNPARWKGHNLQGRTLMDVRRYLKENTIRPEQQLPSKQQLEHPPNDARQGIVNPMTNDNQQN